jgi:predicted transcriptional regulator of viral defense system
MHYVRIGRVARERRGIYRIVHFRRDGRLTRLIEVWLWSRREGIFSYKTALALHGLANLDACPFVYVTVPEAWQSRRICVPDDVALCYADVLAWDRAWHGPIPVTTPRRTFADGAVANLSPEGIRGVLELARKGGVVEPADIAYLERFLSYAERLLHSGRATF